jgi:hypothetical protein
MCHGVHATQILEKVYICRLIIKLNTYLNGYYIRTKEEDNKIKQKKFSDMCTIFYSSLTSRTCENSQYSIRYYFNLWHVGTFKSLHHVH